MPERDSWSEAFANVGALVLMLGLLVLVGLLGLWPLRQTTARAAVIAEVGAHAIAWGAVLFELYFLVPRAQATLRDFGTELNVLARIIFAASDFAYQLMIQRPRLFSSLFAGLLILDGTVLAKLWQDEDSKSLRDSWSILQTAIPLLILITIDVALFVHLLKLMNELA